MFEFLSLKSPEFITSIKSIEFFKCLFFNSSLVVFSRKEQAPGVV